VLGGNSQFDAPMLARVVSRRASAHIYKVLTPDI
jgi:hypothetical protein